MSNFLKRHDTIDETATILALAIYSPAPATWLIIILRFEIHVTSAGIGGADLLVI
jgi:hypothetical protein